MDAGRTPPHLLPIARAAPRHIFSLSRGPHSPASLSAVGVKRMNEIAGTKEFRPRASAAGPSIFCCRHAVLRRKRAICRGAPGGRPGVGHTDGEGEHEARPYETRWLRPRRAGLRHIFSLSRGPHSPTSLSAVGIRRMKGFFGAGSPCAWRARTETRQLAKTL